MERGTDPQSERFSLRLKCLSNVMMMDACVVRMEGVVEEEERGEGEEERGRCCDEVFEIRWAIVMIISRMHYRV